MDNIAVLFYVVLLPSGRRIFIGMSPCEQRSDQEVEDLLPKTPPPRDVWEFTLGPARAKPMHGENTCHTMDKRQSASVVLSSFLYFKSCSLEYYFTKDLLPKTLPPRDVWEFAFYVPSPPPQREVREAKAPNTCHTSVDFCSKSCIP
jgi:hypothetical protein